ncbi:hypothetical protein [Mucilaginibacter sp. UYCu711]|uniref:hypothetical protein n=1 Tax=Mucilaginibacter sp. UYCu711 TaxID=3156339 RepID=UPI003D23FB62
MPAFFNRLKLNPLKNNIWLSVSLLLVCFLVYFPTFNNQFQNFWDDQWVVINHYTNDGFTRKNLWAILSEFYHGQYAPVNQLYYTSLHTIFGYNAMAFHGACLVIHILNVLLVFDFVKKLLRLNKGFNEGSVVRIAYFTAILFAIHPFLVEAVAWISASKILLYAFFYLIALHFYLSYTVNLKLKYYFLTLLFFIIAFGAKEQAVTLPVCFILIDYALNRDFKNLERWLEKLPFFILSVLFGIFTLVSQAVTGSGALSNEAQYPWYQKIIFACYSLVDYLFKCLIPYKLSYLYPFPNPQGFPLPARFWPYPFVVIAVIICLWSFWKQRWVFFGMLFFILHIAVALHIVSIPRFAIVADRYVYVASIGIFFILAWLLDRAFCLKYRYRKILMVLSIAYLCTLGVYTHRRVKTWYDTDSLKQEMRELINQREDIEPVSLY